MPYLASTRFVEGAAAYGLILSGSAGGNLLGVILSGALPKLKAKAINILMFALFLTFGLGIGALAWISVTWLAVADLFILGILNGYLGILLITSLQQNAPKEMLGRLMSMVVLAGIILMPLSQAVSGAVLHWNASVLFLSAGSLLLLCALYLLKPGVNNLLSAHMVNTPSENS